MPEEQPVAKAYIFSLYPEENEAIDVFANANCRGNRSEALRRMIAFTVRHFSQHARAAAPVEMHFTTPEVR